MEWASALSPEEDRAGVMTRGFNRWLEVDPAAATQWFNQHIAEPGDNSQRDQFIAHVASDSPIARSQPQTALGWVERMEEGEMRWQSAEPLILEWWRADPVAAGKYLQKSKAWSETQKASVLQSAKAEL